MRIEIANRWKPYSHQAGARCLLPGSDLLVQAFPTRLEVQNIDGELLGSVNLDVSGPISDFTLQLDLESSSVLVWGQASEGYFRFLIQADSLGKGFRLTAKRLGMPQLSISCTGEWKGAVKSLTRGEDLFFNSSEADFRVFQAARRENLALGSHKAQDWDSIQRRCDLREWLPFLFVMGQQLGPLPAKGTCSLPQLIQNIESESVPEKLPETLNQLLKVGFQDLLVPQMTDLLHQGIVSADIPKGASPLHLFAEAARLIRALFLQANGQELRVLPTLPSYLHCGRMLGWSCGDIGTVDVEWTKKKLRRMIFRSQATGEIQLVLSKDIRSFRLCRGKKSETEVLKIGTPIQVSMGEEISFDQFRK